MNYIAISGRLTKDPVISYNREGTKKFARFTLAVRRNGKDDKADFLSCVAFDKTADLAEKYLVKGTALIIEGHVQTDSYEKDGRKIYTTDVCVSHLEFMERKKDEEKPEEKPEEKDGFFASDDAELPFN